MALTILSGTATHIQHATETSGTTGTRNQPGQISTMHSCSFRINGRPATIKLANAANLGEGDRVTVAGHDRQSGFVGYALRNDTTGAIYSLPSLMPYILGGLLVLIGLPLSAILIGIPLLGVGVWVLFVGRRNASALSLVNSALAESSSKAASVQ